MSKTNSNKGESVPQFNRARSIKEGMGGFKNIREGRTSETQNLQTNPFYKDLFKRRGYGGGWKRKESSSYGVSL